MFSFSTIAVFATLAFSAVTSAIPFNERDAAGELSAVNAALPVVDTVALVPRADDAKLSLASILTDAQTQLVPFTQQLKFATKQNATAEHLSAPVDGIKNVLTTTATRIHGLGGHPIEIILASLDGTLILTVHEVARILAAVLILVFDAVGAVLALLGGGIAPAVFLLLVGVGEVVATLLQAVLAIVGVVLVDLVVVLVPLLGTVIHVIRALGVALLLTLLGL
ncbi:hypothetical protein C8Q77DRAFT_1072289 [Trametes polyzona]|nr:hypothetical protein C8Q77DRAFT_1072289 [Trametes polyzona]